MRSADASSATSHESSTASSNQDLTNNRSVLSRVRACAIPGEVHPKLEPELSNGIRKALDANLIIGRNPAHQPIEPHQRAVTHGEDDRAISRRHVEYKYLLLILQPYV